MRDTGAPLGYDPAAFAEMAEMGWTGVIIPEEYGGSDFGYLSLGLILEETGRTLTASPLLATALAAASAIDPRRQRRAEAGLAAEDRLRRSWSRTLAMDEGPHHAPEKVALAAKKSGAGYTLTGKKTFVLEGMAAGLFVVSARTSGKAGDKDGITLFLVPADAKGVSRQALKLADSRGAANVTFEGVEVGADAVLGEADKGCDAAREDPRPRPRRPGGRDAGLGGAGLRDHARLPEDPRAVRPGDRLVPGAAAPRGEDVHRPRAGPLLRRGGARRHRQRQRPTCPSWSRWPRPRSATPCTWSPTRWCRCTAASA